MAERRQTNRVGDGLRPLRPLVGLWLAGSILLVVLVNHRVIPPEELLLDSNTYGGLNWYTGLVSSLGILGWATAAVAAAGGAWLAGLAGRRGAATMLRSGSTLSILLLLDDLLQLHVVITKSLGLPKSAFYVAYLVLATWWLVTSGRELARTRWVMLAAAVVALGCSILLDQFGGRSVAAVVAEDSCKFLGILAWAQYFVVTGRDIARSIVDRVVEPGRAGQTSPMGRGGGRREPDGGPWPAGVVNHR